jgi:hypothetical protein
MNLIFHHVVQLEHVHNPHTRTFIKWFAGQAIIELNPTVTSKASFFQLFRNRLVADTVKGRCRHLITKSSCCHAEVHFKQLT